MLLVETAFVGFNVFLRMGFQTMKYNTRIVPDLVSTFILTDLTGSSSRPKNPSKRVHHRVLPVLKTINYEAISFVLLLLCSRKHFGVCVVSFYFLRFFL